MRVLAIGAHYDDIEIGCGGALLKHRNNKDEIYMLVITSSDYQDNEHTRLKDDAINEGKKNANIIGANLISGEFKTLELEANKELINYICNIVDEIKPDIVYTHFYGDQHLDHVAVSKSSLIACRYIPKVLMYLSNSYQTIYPFVSNYYVDISKYILQKLELIDNYKSEGTKITKYKEQVSSINKYYGIKNNIDYCEGFMASNVIER